MQSFSVLAGWCFALGSIYSWQRLSRVRLTSVPRVVALLAPVAAPSSMRLNGALLGSLAALSLLGTAVGLYSVVGGKT